MDDFIALLKNPKKDWPTRFTSEIVLCERAAEVITKLLSELSEMEAQYENAKKTGIFFLDLLDEEIGMDTVDNLWEKWKKETGT